MRRCLLLIVMMCFWVAGYAQDVYPLFRNCKSYKESNVVFINEFARAYSYQLKEFKKTNKELYKRSIGEFRDVSVMVQIMADGNLSFKDEKFRDEINSEQYTLIKLALGSMPAWTPWQHSVHNKLYVRVSLRHPWLQ